MCGRYTLYDISKYELNVDIDIKPNYNIAPASKVLIINQKMDLEYVYWSIKPSWSEKINIINARSETLETKNIFRNADRCVFIANGYFEWKRHSSKKIPYYHTYLDRMMFFGGIKLGDRACIVTRSSYPNIEIVHNRQPVFLEYDTFNNWFNKNHNFECYNSSKIEIYEVSDRVNNPANNLCKNIEKFN